MRSTTVAIVSIVMSITVSPFGAHGAAPHQIKPLSEEQAKAYQLDSAFYKKCTDVQDILIATSERVSDHAHLEAAYQFDMIMSRINSQVAQRIRNLRVITREVCTINLQRLLRHCNCNLCITCIKHYVSKILANLCVIRVICAHSGRINISNLQVCSPGTFQISLIVQNKCNVI